MLSRHSRLWPRTSSKGWHLSLQLDAQVAVAPLCQLAGLSRRKDAIAKPVSTCTRLLWSLQSKRAHAACSSGAITTRWRPQHLSTHFVNLGLIELGAYLGCICI